MEQTLEVYSSSVATTDNGEVLTVMLRHPATASAAGNVPGLHAYTHTVNNPTDAQKAVCTYGKLVTVTLSAATGTPSAGATGSTAATGNTGGTGATANSK